MARSFGRSLRGAGGLDNHLPTARPSQRVELQLVILGAATDPGIADSHHVAVGRGRLNRQIVSEPVPEHQRDTPVPGRDPGRRDLDKQDKDSAVPITTDSGTMCS